MKKLKKRMKIKYKNNFKLKMLLEVEHLELSIMYQRCYLGILEG
jgi:hypothetical protein